MPERMSLAEYRAELGLKSVADQPPPRTNIQWEDAIQEEFFTILKFQHPELNCFSIPNGGIRDGKTAGTLSRTGLKAGVLDTCALWPEGNIGFIEFKHGKNGLSKEQKDFAASLDAAGIPYAVCYSAQEALATLREWGAICE